MKKWGGVQLLQKRSWHLQDLKFVFVFFVFIENRHKNRRKKRIIPFIFVTNLRLAPYIVANTSKLGV